MREARHLAPREVAGESKQDVATGQGTPVGTRVTNGYQKYESFSAPDAKHSTLARTVQWKLAGAVVGAVALLGLVLVLVLPRYGSRVAQTGARPMDVCMGRGTAALANGASALSSLLLVLTVNGEAIPEVPITLAYQWAQVGDDLSVVLSDDVVRAWATGDGAALLTSKDSTRTYLRADGKEVTLAGGSYGWEVDGEAFVEALVAHFGENAAGSVEVPMLQTAETWAVHGWDWGQRYLDVDLEEQYVRFYDGPGNIIWESPCVTGQPNQNHETPEGVYTINEHMGRNQELRGLDENHDGEPDYISHVDYWMPFYENLVAFHDASWRGSFGGTIYQYYGSHGCVNLPVARARELFDIIQLGDVVVVHQ